MKFTCTQENLLRGLGRTTPTTGRNTQLPILQHVLIQNKKGTLHLTSTDLEIGVHTSVGGKSETEGSCTVPAHSFFEYVQQLPSTHPIILETKGNVLLVSTKDFHAQFPTSNPDDFPLLPTSKGKYSISIDAPLLCQVLSQSLFAAAKDDTRPEIHSVYLHTKDELLLVVATDSFRLVEEAVPMPHHQSLSLLIPLSTAQEISRLFSGQQSVTLYPSQNYMMVKSNDADLTSRLVSGNFPDYQQIIPQQQPSSIQVSCFECVRALKTLSVFLPRESRRVQLNIKPKKGEVVAKVAGGEAGQGDVRFGVQGSGENVDIMLNIQYLIEGIQHIPSEECAISFAGPQDPVVIRPVGEDIKLLYVVMPIQAT